MSAIENTVRRSETTAALAGALAKAQGSMANPTKDSENPHFKSRFADLATVRNAVIPALSANGLAVIQLPTEMPDGRPALVTILLHMSGEWVETMTLLRQGQNTPQGVGAALTYARRYALQSIAGVAAEDDDDGNAATSSRRLARDDDEDDYPEPVRPAPAKPAALPPKPVDDVAALARLLSEYGTAVGLTPVEVFRRLIAAAGWPGAIDMYDDLNATQLATACKSLREKLAAKSAEKQAEAKKGSE